VDARVKNSKSRNLCLPPVWPLVQLQISPYSNSTGSATRSLPARGLACPPATRAPTRRARPRPPATARNRPQPPATARKNGGDRPRVLGPDKRGVWPPLLLHPRRPQAQGRLMRLGAAHPQQGARPPPARARGGVSACLGFSSTTKCVPAVVDLPPPSTRPCFCGLYARVARY